MVQNRPHLRLPLQESLCESSEFREGPTRYSRAHFEAILRLLRGELEVAGSGKGTDGVKVLRRRAFRTQIQRDITLLHNQHRKDVELMKERWKIELELRRN